MEESRLHFSIVSYLRHIRKMARAAIVLFLLNLLLLPFPSSPHTPPQTTPPKLCPSPRTPGLAGSSSLAPPTPPPPCNTSTSPPPTESSSPATSPDPPQ